MTPGDSRYDTESNASPRPDQSRDPCGKRRKKGIDFLTSVLYPNAHPNGRVCLTFREPKSEHCGGKVLIV